MREHLVQVEVECKYRTTVALDERDLIFLEHRRLVVVAQGLAVDCQGLAVDYQGLVVVDQARAVDYGKG